MEGKSPPLAIDHHLVARLRPQVGRGSDIGNNLLVEVAQGGQVAHFERAHGLAYPIESFLRQGQRNCRLGVRES